MADIRHHFPVNASVGDVYRAVSTPAGLDQWWTKGSTGEPAQGEEYSLDFGPGYKWRARVTRCVANRVFELTFTDAHKDWAMYLRILKRYVEHGETVPYARRLYV